MNVKKITLNAILLTVMGLVSSSVSAQVNLKNTSDEHAAHNDADKKYVRCATVEYEADLKSKVANRQSTEEFEQWLAPLVAKLKADQAANRSVAAVYNIPVVIHIVHDGDCVGTGENITDAQAISQITVMNQDYRRMVGTPGGANTTGLATDIEINFILAQRDPSGNPTTGIVRHQITPYSNTVTDGVGGPDWETRADTEAMKQATIWDPTKYLNMWTIRAGGLDLSAGGQSGLLGYAQFPQGSGLTGITPGTVANTDGVVASFDAFGTNAQNDGTFILNPTYNLGRTMTHEVGHWLGLRHIWGDAPTGATCPTTNNATTLDYCADTPAAIIANYTCNLTANSCTSTPGNDMVQNYMDYTNDLCMDTFTPDQKVRMQTVMANSVRRNSLNTSDGATIATGVGIYFNKGIGKCDVNEGTDCSFIDVNYAVAITKAPATNVVVAFAPDASSTATNLVDYQIMTPTVTFNSGSTTPQNLTVRYFGDGISEPTETVVINMVPTGAVLVPTAETQLKVSIIDNDDAAPVTTQDISLINATFTGGATGWTVRDGDGDGKNWGLLNTALNGYGTAPNLISGNCAFSEKNLTYLAGTGAANPNNFFISPQVTIPAGAISTTLSYIVGAYDNVAAGATRKAGDITVYFTTDVSSAAAITAGTVIQPAISIDEATTQLITNNITISGQTGYFVFRHSNNAASVALLLLDSVILNTTAYVAIQSDVNTATKFQAAIPAVAGTIYAKDVTSKKIILDATTPAFNYGCTSVEVNRSLASAGSPAVNYGTNTANNLKVLAKTFLVTPTTNNPTGSANLKFYFTEAEIAAWEAATGNSRNAIKVFKDGQNTFYPVTIGSFASTNVTLSATTPTGLAGTYYFGIDSIVLGTTPVDALSGISIYPNPASTELNINMEDGISENTKYTIFNNLGQTLKSVKVNSNSDLKINTASYSQGVYIIKIEKDGNSKTLKFIKE